MLQPVRWYALSGSRRGCEIASRPSHPLYSQTFADVTVHAAKDEAPIATVLNYIPPAEEKNSPLLKSLLEVFRKRLTLRVFNGTLLLGRSARIRYTITCATSSSDHFIPHCVHTKEPMSQSHIFSNIITSPLSLRSRIKNVSGKNCAICSLFILQRR